MSVSKTADGSSNLSTRANIKVLNIMNMLKDFFRESYEELIERVSWPTYAELQSSTTLVLVSSIIFALAISAVDYGFTTAMNWFYHSF
jgi:preprotein translocase subunit SecE